MESARVQNDSLTPSQRQAVTARGNVLVMAGAGTGKTHTLVERCLDCLCRERVSLDEILVVTFTEAAATEMKRRLRSTLEKKLSSHLPGVSKQGRGSPGAPEQNESGSTLNQHLAEQLALFDIAHIGTLHSFCLKLVREHFYELGLDPQLTMLDEGEMRLLMEETLDAQFQSHYAGQTDFSVAVQNLIQVYGNGDERPIRAMVLRLHHYAQTRPDADRWLAEQHARFASLEPVEWRKWLTEAVRDWREEWLPVLENLGVPVSEPVRNLDRAGSETGAPAANEKAAELTNILRQLPKNFSREAAADTLKEIISADGNWPAKRKTALRKPLAGFFADAAFLHSLGAGKNGDDPLAEDWDWVRGHMTTLLQLTQEFAAKFAERKRAESVLDFHDLEQFALKLLWDFTVNKPTAAADRWRQKIRFVFVDEYQDINAAQDKIIQALSRSTLECGDMSPLSSTRHVASNQSADTSTHSKGNRFLVGDMKQSIYRFRLADPKIFRDYVKQWQGNQGQTIPLTENFRSRESLLGFVNSMFESLMREDIGGVNYDAEARLQFASSKHRAVLSLAQDPAPRTELWFRMKKGSHGETTEDESDNGELAGLEETEKEARLVARRLREIADKGHKVWDEEKRTERPVQWQDMAVLLRAPSGKSEAYAKEFERAGVPLLVERGGFYESTEIADLLSLLKLLDNPLQDVPAIAVLRSPLVGLSLDELATIRLAAKDVHFWTALNRRQQTEGKTQKQLDQKLGQFLERYSRWRQLARQVSLSQCLESVLAETHYAEWLPSRPRGAQRQANIVRFVGLAQQFDQFQRQGLFRFLKFIEAQQNVEAEPEAAPVAGENAVRLMSIHQSKGLEFPVVVVADLAKAFNERDLRGEIIFDEQFGLCPRVKPPHTGRRYPSLPHWLAQKHQRRAQRGEELRLLYVAMTRARDTLILTATVSENKWESLRQKAEAITSQAIVSAKSYADWLTLWFQVQNTSGSDGVSPANVSTDQETGRQDAGTPGAKTGELPHLRWRMVEDTGLGDDSTSRSRGDEAQITDQLETPRVISDKGVPVLDAATAERLRAMLTWNYPFDVATRRAAKSSVTTLRRQAEELDDEAEQMFQVSRYSRLHPKAKSQKPKLSAAAAGTAHHKFLQFVSLEQANRLPALQAEAERLQRAGVLSPGERAALDLEAVATFWDSAAGRKIRVQPTNCIKRELPFTAKFRPAEVDAIIGAKTPPGLADEFVVVQGVADLVVLLPEAIWLVDFKTDEIKSGELAERKRLYGPQLRLYAEALSRIYTRPLTNCWLHFLVPRRTVGIRINQRYCKPDHHSFGSGVR